MAWTDKPCIIGTRRTSRRLWFKLYGDPGKLWVLHYCDVAVCQEPTHLYLGTASDNQRDTVRAGKNPWQNKSAEHLAKTGAALRGRVMSAEARAKMSTAHKGTTKSAETRAKMSAARYRWHQAKKEASQ